MVDQKRTNVMGEESATTNVNDDGLVTRCDAAHHVGRCVGIELTATDWGALDQWRLG